MHIGNIDVLITPELPKITGMSRLMSLLRKNPRYWPNIGAVFVLVPAFAAISFYHTLKGPEVSLLRHTNAEPWQKFDHKKHVFYMKPIDHDTYAHQRPNF